MDIDLFLSPHAECGLLCNEGLSNLPAGVIFDAETNELTIEFVEDDPLHLNIPIEESLQEQILMAHKLYIAVLEDGMIAETIDVPLLYLNDPYGGDFNAHNKMRMPTRTLKAFEQFMKRCTFAQPVHRDDLNNEDTSRSILRGANPKQLEFQPQLTRQHMLEMGPQGPSGPAIQAGPRPMGPRGPGGMGGGSGGNVVPTRRAIPPKKSDED